MVYTVLIPIRSTNRRFIASSIPRLYSHMSRHRWLIAIITRYTSVHIVASVIYDQFSAVSCIRDISKYSLCSVSVCSSFVYLSSGWGRSVHYKATALILYLYISGAVLFIQFSPLSVSSTFLIGKFSQHGCGPLRFLQIHCLLITAVFGNLSSFNLNKYHRISFRLSIWLWYVIP